jgi:hypothetical protein
VAPSAREEWLGLNEAIFRAANERMEAWEERHWKSETELYYCECADPKCREKVHCRHADYEKARADPSYFLIVQGHEDPEIETVIEEHEGWAIVEKEPELKEEERRLDRRSDS